MVRNHFLAASLAVLVGATIGACSRATQDEGRAETSSPASPATPMPERDIHSFARPQEVRVSHVALDLTADFAPKSLSGRATLTLERAAGATQVVLDTRDLTIQGVTAPDGAPLKFALGESNPILGQALTIDLPAGIQEIVVAYRTSPN